MSSRLLDILRAWARLGGAFNVAPAAETPDLERLLVETVRAGRDHARLFAVAAAWLKRHGSLVARHRLARLAVESLGEREQAILAWLLDEAAEHGGPRFREVCSICRPAREAAPVFAVHERMPALRARLERRRSAAARRWNLLAEPIEPADDAVRAPEWIRRENPDLRLRALLAGDLRASILAAIAADPDAGASEVELARRCGATRGSVREALSRLALSGQIVREQVGRRHAIRLATAAA